MKRIFKLIILTMIFFSFKSFSFDAKRSADLLIQDKKNHQIESFKLTFVTSDSLGYFTLLNDVGKKICEGRVITLKNDYVFKNFKCIQFEQIFDNIIFSSKNKLNNLTHGLALIDTNDSLIGIVLYYGLPTEVINLNRINDEDFINMHGKFPFWKDILIDPALKN